MMRSDACSHDEMACYVGATADEDGYWRCGTSACGKKYATPNRIPPAGLQAAPSVPNDAPESANATQHSAGSEYDQALHRLSRLAEILNDTTDPIAGVVNGLWSVNDGHPRHELAADIRVILGRLPSDPPPQSRPEYLTGAQLSFEGGGLSLDLRKKRGHLAFTDDHLEPVREYDDDGVWDGYLVKLPNTELEAIRDFLNKWLPTTPDAPHQADTDPKEGET